MCREAAADNGEDAGSVGASKPDFALFVTAPACPGLLLNEILIRMRDFEYSDNDDDYTTLVTLRTDLTDPLPVAIVPLPESLDSTNNSFAGATLQEVYDWLQEQAEAARACSISSSLYVVVDEVSLSKRPLECIIVEQCYYEEDDESGEERDGDEERHLDSDREKQDITNGAARARPQLRALRLPCEQAWITLANLKIGNMDFEDFAGETEEPGPDGTYQWVPLPDDPNPDVARRAREDEDAMERKRLERLAQARRQGWIE